MDSHPSLQHQISLPILQKPFSGSSQTLKNTGKIDNTSNGKRGTMLKTFSVYESGETKPKPTTEQHVFDKLPLRPSLVAQISSESQKAINHLKKELKTEQEKNKKALLDVVALKKLNDDLSEQFDLYKQITDKSIEELKQSLRDLEERGKQFRYSKELTDDTISSSEAGKFSEVILVNKEDVDIDNTEKTMTESGSDIMIPFDSKQKKRKAKKKDKSNNSHESNDEIKDKARSMKEISQKIIKKRPSGSDSEETSKTKSVNKSASSQKIEDTNLSTSNQTLSLKLPIKSKKKEIHGDEQRSRSISIDSNNPSDSRNSILTENQWLIDYNDIFFIEAIGKGCASTVYSGTYQSKEIAIKVLRLENRERDVEDFKKEMEIMSAVKSPHIVDFYGACFSPKPCIVLELCSNGTLFHYLQNEKNEIDWGQAIQWLIDATRSIVTLHNWSPQIVHRDLKTLNLLLDSNLNIKTCDFGLSRFVSGEHDQKTFFKMRGTYAYIAPEVYNGHPFTSKSDIYSLGIIIWEIIHRVINGKHMRPYGEYPKIVHDFQIIVQAATKGLRPNLPSNTPPEFKKLFSLCVHADSDMRPNSEELVEQLENIQKIYNENKENWDSQSHCSVIKNLFPPPKYYRKGHPIKVSGKELVRNKQTTRNLREDLEKKGILVKNLSENNHDLKIKTDNRYSVTLTPSFDTNNLARFRSVSQSSIEKKSSGKNISSPDNEETKENNDLVIHSN